ncbi:pentapeptide repeat-containing protein [Actinoplanes philippinensis]|uniref:pentapeptide repeat-containing protein n=1 Tax=Actinoplanes philippinensis TaxID=35752 RepID=UPI0033CAC493
MPCSVEAPYDISGVAAAGTSGADLREADLRDTDLSYAGFGPVRTHDPSFGRIDVTGALWQGAVLRGVTAEDVIGWPCEATM